MTFEEYHQDALRDFGYSKDKKFNEVQVVMGLATDKQRLALDYGLQGTQAEGLLWYPLLVN